MKRLIIFLITFLFFVFGVNNVFASVEPMQKFYFGDDYYYFNENKIYNSKGEIKKNFDQRLNFLYFDPKLKKFYFIYFGNYFYIEKDFSIYKKGYNSDSSYKKLYGGEFTKNYVSIPGFSYSPRIVLLGSYLYNKFDSNSGIVTLVLRTDDGNFEFSYKSDNRYYNHYEMVDEATIISLKLNDDGTYNSFTYNFLTKNYIENKDNFKADDGPVKLIYDFKDSYIIKSGNKEKRGKIRNFGKCYKKDISYVSMRSFFEKDLTFKKFVDEDYFKSIIFGESGRKYEHSIGISNVENLTGFSFENITKKGNITFDFKNDFYRLFMSLPFKSLDFYEYPRVNISSVEPIEWIKIDGTLPNGNTKFGKLVKCGGVGFGGGDFLEGFGHLEIGKFIKFKQPSENICIQLNYTGVGTTSINIDFGTTSFQIHETDVCENDEGEIFVNGEKFDGKKEDLENGIDGFDVDLSEEKILYHNEILDLNKLSEIKTNGDGFLTIGSGKINDPIVENGKCKLFNENNLTFLYYSNGSISINLSVKNIGFLDNSFGGIIDFVGGLFIGPLNNIIGLTGIITPFTFDNQEVCLFGDLKTIEFHKMMKGTDYYGKMTILDYIVIFTFGSFIFFIIGGISFFKGISTPEGEYKKYKYIPYSKGGYIENPHNKNR